MRRDLAPGGPGHAFIAEAERQPADLCVDKHHYSAFATAVCPLSVELAARHINTVLIAGVLTNVCCESSARDASIQGFRVVLLSDANGARNAVEHVAALSSIAQCFGDVRASDDTIALMEASSAPADGAPALA